MCKQQDWRKAKYKNWWEPRIFLLQANSPIANMYSVIGKICLNFNLLKHYVSPFLQKEVENMVKGLIIFKVWSLEKLFIFIAKLS